MKILTFSEFIELRDLLSENRAGKLHMRDACGSQSFTLDDAEGKAEELIQSYLSEKRLKAVFHTDGAGFTIDEK